MDHLRHSKIEIVEVRTLRTYDRNARLHSSEQIDQIANSITQFGFTNPLLVDETGEIIAGHGRLAAALKLGLNEVPIIRIIGLSVAEKRALVLADNKLALNATWDDKLLAEELRSLQISFDSGEFDIDFGTIGFSDLEIADLMSLLETAPPPEEPRAIEVEDEPAVSRPGETWQLGPHRLSIGGKEIAKDADLMIRQWERETKEDAKLATSGETFKSRAASLGIEFVRPAVKSQKARSKAAA
jgi:ParB-like chromosome segregation protein Spo0J